MGKMQRNRNDVISEIKTARDEARVKAHAYMSLTVKKYDYWRAMSAVIAYDDVLALYAQNREIEIQALATKADREFENARDGDVTEMTLAMTDGRRDALASVADLMNTKDNS